MLTQDEQERIRRAYHLEYKSMRVIAEATGPRTEIRAKIGHRESE
jgi:hypothetical protein